MKTFTEVFQCICPCLRRRSKRRCEEVVSKLLKDILVEVVEKEWQEQEMEDEVFMGRLVYAVGTLKDFQDSNCSVHSLDSKEGTMEEELITLNFSDFSSTSEEYEEDPKLTYM